MLDKHNKIWETHLFTYINAEHHDVNDNNTFDYTLSNGCGFGIGKPIGSYAHDGIYF